MSSSQEIHRMLSQCHNSQEHTNCLALAHYLKLNGTISQAFVIPPSLITRPPNSIQYGGGYSTLTGISQTQIDNAKKHCHGM